MFLFGLELEQERVSEDTIFLLLCIAQLVKIPLHLHGWICFLNVKINNCNIWYLLLYTVGSTKLIVKALSITKVEHFSFIVIHFENIGTLYFFATIWFWIFLMHAFQIQIIIYLLNTCIQYLILLIKKIRFHHIKS